MNKIKEKEYNIKRNIFLIDKKIEKLQLQRTKYLDDLKRLLKPVEKPQEVTIEEKDLQYIDFEIDIYQES